MDYRSIYRYENYYSENTYGRNPYYTDEDDEDTDTDADEMKDEY